MNKTFVALALVKLLAACSIDVPEDQAEEKEASPKNEIGEVKANTLDRVNDGGYLSGYISAWNVTFGGQFYSNSEVYYTEQIDRLAEEAAENGYEDYVLTFDGQLGISDFKYNTKVFVIAQGGSGYGIDTKVLENGRFLTGIPDGEGHRLFTVRTNKRVSVVLSSADGGDSVKWCYNVSGVASDASLHDVVIIDEFVTSLTKYACEAHDNQGISIPSKKTVTKKKSEVEAAGVLQ